VASQLLSGASHRAPQPLLFIRHEAQNQFSGYMPSPQSFGVGVIPLPPLRRAIGVRLRQMQLSFNCRSSACHTGFQYCAVDSITASLTPDSASQPASAQFRLSGTELAPLKPELAHLGCIRNHHRQHLLVYVDTGYFVTTIP
jgi:hypothetical protein